VGTLDASDWDWTRIVIDHLDVHAANYAESVRFYETVLAPLGIPRIGESNEGACFTNVNVVDRKPATTSLHLCFHARSREQVDAFHAAGLAAGLRSKSRRSPSERSADRPSEHGLSCLPRAVDGPPRACRYRRQAESP
jgi:catechol 2,3-dioxygenase-like lactoylglutathione lyase family enzyme